MLAGDQLRVSSNSLPDSQVKAAYRKAVQNSKGKPDLALLRFVQTLPESKYAPPKPGRPGNDGRPAPETPPAKVQQEEELTLAESQPTGPAEGAPQAAPKDDGSAMPFLLGGGLVAVAAAGAGGFLLWRRRSLTPSAAPRRSRCGRCFRCARRSRCGRRARPGARARGSAVRWGAGDRRSVRARGEQARAAQGRLRASTTRRPCFTGPPGLSRGIRAAREGCGRFTCPAGSAAGSGGARPRPPTGPCPGRRGRRPSPVRAGCAARARPSRAGRCRPRPR